MKLYFRWVHEERPGAAWADRFRRSWPGYRAWFLREGEQARPSLAESRAQLRMHMPELEPQWDRLSRLSGQGEMAARMLALYRPPAYLGGCSQAVLNRGEPMLVRNYDYHPALFEGTISLSHWTPGNRVMGTSDCLWGLLDGMNEHGLAVALSFAGERTVGEGFGIPLILRYILEQSRSVAEATEVLRRVPSHMSYNVSLLDASGVFAVANVAPGRPTEVSERAVATNHHGAVRWPEYAEATQTVQREHFLEKRLRQRGLTAGALRSAFLAPPLYGHDYERGLGTLYSVAYFPRSGRSLFFWPAFAKEQSFDSFSPEEFVLPVKT